MNFVVLLFFVDKFYFFILLFNYSICLKVETGQRRRLHFVFLS